MTSISTIIKTLHSQSPFDLVPTAILETIAAQIGETRFERGRVILDCASTPHDLYVVIDGTVDVLSGSAISESLVHNEAFPLEALQSPNDHLQAGYDYVARNDVNLLTIPAAVIARLRTECSDFDDFCQRQNGSNAQRQTASPDISGVRSALNLDLRRLLPKRTMMTLPPQATIDDVVIALHETKAREIVIVQDGVAVGIFTRSDLVSRVLMPKLPLDTAVSQVMTTDLVTLSVNSPGFEAVIEMHQRGVSRVILVDENGHFVSVVTDSDLLYALQDSSNLYTIIMRAETEADLVRAADKVRELASGLIADGVDADHLTQLVSTLNDHLVERVVTLTAQQADISMDSFCWIALGSEGRHEQTLHTDQDNAIVFAVDDPEQLEPTREKLLAFAHQVNVILDKCGFDLCPGNIMAGNPECCLTAEEWQRRFALWINEPKPQALLYATIFFDLRPLCGNRALGEDLVEWLMGAVVNRKRFFHLMMENALQRPPPIGLFRDFAVDKADSCLDIKLSGLALLVDAARILGLSCGCRTSATVDRLRSALDQKILSADDTANMIAAFDLMQKLRLRQHNAQLSQDEPTSNRINPYALNAIDRKSLLEALRHANTLQKIIGTRYSLEMRR